MTTAYLALGSNLDDRAANLFAAMARISRLDAVEVGRVSDLFETDAVGGPADSPPFLNAAMGIRTSLGARALMKSLLEIEQELGRIRTQRWAPRLIDLDLLLYGDAILAGPEPIVPHPLMHQRRFVLEPLAQIAPDAVHPALRMSVAGLLAALNDGDPTAV